MVGGYERARIKAGLMSLREVGCERLNKLKLNYFFFFESSSKILFNFIFNIIIPTTRNINIQSDSSQIVPDIPSMNINAIERIHQNVRLTDIFFFIFVLGGLRF